MLEVLNQDRLPFFSHSGIHTINWKKLKVCKLMFGVQERGAKLQNFGPE